MNTDRRLWLWSQVVEHARGAPVTVEHICSTLLSATGTDGVAVTLTLGDGTRETLYASDRTAAELAESVLTVGEGPGLLAGVGGPVLVGDLTDRESANRWPIFASAALALGARAVVALPLQVGGIRLGVIELYRSRPGRLTQEQVDDGLMLADTACALLIDSTEDTLPNPDGHGPEGARLQHPEVHQATGMVIVQLGVTAAVALVRLRAYAYAQDRRLQDVARDVVARRLRFHPDQVDGR